MRKLAQATVMTGVVLALLAGPAQAATTLGETFTPTEDFGGSGTFFQSTSPANGYEAPSAGVITSWSFEAGAVDAPPMKLKILRPAGGNDFTTVGESALETPTLSTLNTWTTRVPVEAGDILGVRYTDTTVGFRAGQPGYATHESTGADVPPGTTATYSGPGSQSQIDLAATLEADADGDGFGDESQDACPTDASTNGECPVPDTDPPETRISKDAPKKTDKSKVKFKFKSDEPGSTFECKKDKKPWKPCTSPTKMKRLDDGKHKFKVRATDPAGNRDPRPAKDKFKVVED